MSVTPAADTEAVPVADRISSFVTRIYPSPNPVLVKELRGRFRAGRAFLVMTLFLLLASASVAFTVSIATQFQSAVMSGGMGSSVPGAMTSQSLLGGVIFSTVHGLGLVLVTLLGPILTAGAISGEKERQTWELLLATPLTGHEIVRGKVVAAMAYIALLVFSALPVMSLAFIFGGVSLTTVLVSQAQLLATGFVYTSLGALASTLTGTTARAIIASYGVIFFMFCGSFCSVPYMMLMSLVSPQFTRMGAGALALMQVLGAISSTILGLAFLLAAGSRVRTGARSVAGVVLLLLVLWCVVWACTGPMMSSLGIGGMMNPPGPFP